jgi:hypothetical protein
MSRSYTASPPSTSVACSGTALLYPQDRRMAGPQLVCTQRKKYVASAGDGIPTVHSVQTACWLSYFSSGEMMRRHI